MSRRLEAQQIISEIRYQLWPYPTTWGSCSCGKGTARAGRRCAECLCEDLKQLSGTSCEVDDWFESQKEAMLLERDILDESEQQTALDELTKQSQELGLYDDP